MGRINFSYKSGSYVSISFKYNLRQALIVMLKIFPHYLK